MEKREEKPVEPSKKPYEAPILVERKDLLQITEGGPGIISEAGILP
jgi:hypothetical protein